MSTTLATGGWALEVDAAKVQANLADLTIFLLTE
eukprot:CAMPEP_0173157762 /NCGR_PEP_ID=MMETSP1105-20130129/15848_1 /TAXON_ID=2985 /ORGANISM="Ochromonas sp., Strain BG-1" /LENGTH=33 /DNA_ID= /DNA_START= /DNA_END= /DNA_ORIENTATION=